MLFRSQVDAVRAHARSAPDGLIGAAVFVLVAVDGFRLVWALIIAVENVVAVVVFVGAAIVVLKTVDVLSMHCQ